MTLPARNFKFQISNFKLKKGFTLIELLVVITIIGLLTAIAASSYTQAQKKGRDGKRKTDLKSVQQALELYFQTNGVYPDKSAGSMVCTVGSPSTISWGGNFSCNSVTYMNPTPKDPTEITLQYYYERGYDAASDSNDGSTNKYRLSALIENTNDPEYCTVNCRSSTKLPCEPKGGYSYCVINP
jgi:type II secretion system protein G